MENPMMLREDKGFSDHNLHEIMTAPPITREQSAQLRQQRAKLRRSLEEKHDRKQLGLDHWNS
ncbi:hypothetical protein LJR269_006571 [Duganella sp. LjRoot269]